MMEKGSRNVVRGALVSMLVFLALVAVLWVGLGQVDDRSTKEQASTLEETVRRATVLCYAVEGRYPSNVDELREQYGLRYNQDRYIVTIDAFASNLLPDISVLVVGGGKYE